MYDYIAGIKWKGQLSYSDADLLAYYAKQSECVLEFGTGGSTHIFSQINKYVMSVETDPNWASVTRSQLQQLGTEDVVRIIEYSWFQRSRPRVTFDMIFVDGHRDMREQFAIKAWKYLNGGGTMVFHDTDRPFNVKSILRVAERFMQEIECININPHISGNDTQLTCIKKRMAPWSVRQAWSKGRPEWSMNNVPNDTQFIVLEKQ